MTAPNSQRIARITAAIFTFILSMVLTAVKLWVYDFTESQAVLSDALEGLVNVAASMVGIYVVWFSDKPADLDHPYGHGKLEYFSAAFEGGLIFFAAMMICGEAIQALLHSHAPQALSRGAVYLAFTSLAMGLAGGTLIWVGKKYESLALRASGHHLISDFVTSVAVILGLILIDRTGWVWLDSVLAIGAAVYLGWTGFRVSNEAFGGLLDREDPEVLEELRELFLKHLFPGIIQIHHVRVIRSGRFHHVDAHIVVPEFWTTAESHEAVHEFEAKVFAEYRNHGEIHVHIDPCQRKYCRFCDLPQCPIRDANFVERRPLSLEELKSPMEPA